MAIELRRARMRDAAALLPLWQEAHDWHVAAHPRYFAAIGKATALETLRHELESAANDPNELWTIAKASLDENGDDGDDGDDDGIVGFAHARVRRPAPIAAFVPMVRLEIVQIVVAASARRRQIGSRLLEGVRTWGRERGAQELVLTVWEGNDAATHFYARHGLVSLHRVLASPLSP